MQNAYLRYRGWYRLCWHNFEHNRHIFLVRIMLAYYYNRHLYNHYENNKQVFILSLTHVMVNICGWLYYMLSPRSGELASREPVEAAQKKHYTPIIAQTFLLAPCS